MNSGCPNYSGRNKNTWRFTFVEYLDSVDTTLSKLENVGHVPGAKCCCPECEALKRRPFHTKNWQFLHSGVKFLPPD